MCNSIRANKNIPIISADLAGDEFAFKFDYVSADTHIKSRGFLTVSSNQLKFFIDDEWSSASAWSNIFNCFDTLNPHIELRCPSKKCGMEYYLASEEFKYKNYNPFNTSMELQPFTYYENCTIGKTWVHNKERENCTYLFSTIHHNSDLKRLDMPVKVPLIDFESFGKEKLITRIKTIINFS
jgi:hypothetical protein